MERLPDIDVLLLGAVPLEISALLESLQNCQELVIRGRTIWYGPYAGLSVLVGTTGLGKVNAAITTTSLLERFAVRQVWHIGCAGAYPEGRLNLGDVLLTEQALCGDEGILTREGVLPASQIGIPMLVKNGENFFDDVPIFRNGTLQRIIAATPQGLYRQRRDLPRSAAHPHESAQLLARCSFPTGDNALAPGETCFRFVHGPSLTVGMVSGDPLVASERFRRYGAYAENMEGSAVAHTCCRFQVPMAECRGVSNFAGIRDKDGWRLAESIAHCHGIIINWLDSLNTMKMPP